jgi:DinB superfamily
MSTHAIEALREQIRRLDERADDLARGLDAARLAWRPPSGAWSIAENIDHLCAMGRWYFKQLDRSLADAEARGLAAGPPVRLPLLERFVVWLAEPPVRRVRIKAPPLFQPQAGFDPLAVLPAYHAHHAALHERLTRAERFDLARARARTPLARRPATLLGCLSLMLAHERRHLWQAEQVVAQHPQ